MYQATKKTNKKKSNKQRRQIFGSLDSYDLNLALVLSRTAHEGKESEIYLERRDLQNALQESCLSESEKLFAKWRCEYCTSLTPYPTHSCAVCANVAKWYIPILKQRSLAPVSIPPQKHKETESYISGNKRHDIKDITIPESLIEKPLITKKMKLEKITSQGGSEYDNIIDQLFEETKMMDHHAVLVNDVSVESSLQMYYEALVLELQNFLGNHPSDIVLGYFMGPYDFLFSTRGYQLIIEDANENIVFTVMLTLSDCHYTTVELVSNLCIKLKIKSPKERDKICIWHSQSTCKRKLLPLEQLFNYL